MAINRYRVPTDKLRWTCDEKFFTFECTKDLTPLGEFIGQDRATRAIEFGLAMERVGYNIYVAGLAGTGKTSMVKTYIEKVSREKENLRDHFRLQDWCYFHNFADLDRPQIVPLPAGRGKVFRDRVLQLKDDLKDGLSKAFSSEQYELQKKQIVEEAQAEQKQLFEGLSQEAKQQGFVMEMTPMGAHLVPLHEGKPIPTADYASLSEEERNQIEERRSALAKRVDETFEKARDTERRTMERVSEQDRQLGEFTISRLFGEVAGEYKDEPLWGFLEQLKAYTLDHLDIFKQPEGQAQAPQYITTSAGPRDPYIPFHVNVFVDNGDTKGPPVVEESNPIYSNLFGKIERRFFMGGYLSDHTMLKPGALHVANGGYLLLAARDVLQSPGVWEALKRALRKKEVRLEDPLELMGFIAPQGMRPQPMPLEVKVVLVGDGNLYQTLSTYDEDFWELFRVKADFDFVIERTPQNLHAYAAFICGTCEKEGLRHYTPSGVAKVAEYGARLVADQDKLSSRFAQIQELVTEGDYWAARDGAERVEARHVRRAIDEKLYRHNLLEHRIREMIRQGTIMIDVDGEQTGQVNGLSVYTLGDTTFGRPSRVTAQTFMGRRGVINIEREAHLSGRIHDKGVMILSGYLGWKYAQDKPLSLSASICFEQSYDGIEGDSASSTELYAILSSLAELPLRQDLAVTGSVNQKGEIQAIGGVNEKIEGFYAVCKVKGLTGRQGVMIPHQNVRHLMLKEEVVEAVDAGKFHIYAIKTVDDGMEVLTGGRAGQRGRKGEFPASSINGRVDRRLRELARSLARFGPEAAAWGQPEDQPDP